MSNDNGNPPAPYALYLGPALDYQTIKTGTGLVRWRRKDVLCEIVSNGTDPSVTADPENNLLQSVRIGERTVEDVVMGLLRSGVRTLVNVYNAGLPFGAEFLDLAEACLLFGINVASGTHYRLSDTRLAETPGALAKTYDFRFVERAYPLATGRKRRGLRLLTIGGDGVIGKKYTALALREALVAQEMSCTFCASGQTGRLLCSDADRFIVMDTTPVDFASGAAEWLSPDHDDPGHWYLVEGQASIFHPAWGPPSLALMYGSQPDALVYCVDVARKKMIFTADYPIRDLVEDAIAQERMARVTNPNAKLLGFSFNQSEASGQGLMRELHLRGFNVFDPSLGMEGAKSIVEWMRLRSAEARHGDEP